MDDVYDQLAEIESRCYVTKEAADVLHIGERSVRQAFALSLNLGYMLRTIHTEPKKHLTCLDAEGA